MASLEVLLSREQIVLESKPPQNPAWLTTQVRTLIMVGSTWCSGAGSRSRRVGLFVGLILASVLGDAGVALATPAYSQVVGSPFAAGSQPWSVAFSPSGGLLASANKGSNTVSVFAVGSDVALTAVTGSPFATGSLPYSVAFSPSGGLLAVANEANSTASVFAVGSDGALTAVTGSPFTAGSAPYSVAFSPTGGLLATGNYGNTTSCSRLGRTAR